MTEGNREIKVGLFVFIAFVLLSVIVFSISDFYTLRPRYTYGITVQFGFANGVQEGAPVRLAGVEVGEVQAVRVRADDVSQRTLAELDIRLARDARVEKDAVATINTLGFIGEKYLEIVPGTPGADLLKEGGVLTGKDSVPAEKLVESGYEAAEELKLAVASLNQILGDPETRVHLKETLANSSEATAELTELMRRANVVMAKVSAGEGTVGKLLMDQGMYDKIDTTVDDIKRHPWKLFFRPKKSKRESRAEKNFGP